mgnify:FL=1
MLARIYDKVAQHALAQLQTPDDTKAQNCSQQRKRKRKQQKQKQIPQDSCVFQDVIVSLPLSSALMNKADHKGQGNKNMVLQELMYPSHTSIPAQGEKKPIAYAIGLASNTKFEVAISKHYEVHGFDCTVSPSAHAVLNQPFLFHPICIGNNQQITNTVYGNSNSATPSNNSMTFVTLVDIMAKLHHEKLSLLKMDIEGAEWEVLNMMLTTFQTSQLPEQLLFELHTEHANPIYVPPNLVQHRGRKQVKELFVALFAAGYRVISKEINYGDEACAEFSLLRVDGMTS